MGFLGGFFWVYLGGFFLVVFNCQPCLDGLAAGDGQEDEDPVAVAGLGDEAALCGGLEAPDPGGTVVGQGRLQGAQAPVARSYCAVREAIRKKSSGTVCEKLKRLSEHTIDSSGKFRSAKQCCGSGSA